MPLPELSNSVHPHSPLPVCALALWPSSCSSMVPRSFMPQHCAPASPSKLATKKKKKPGHSLSSLLCLCLIILSLNFIPSKLNQHPHYTQSTIWVFFITFNITYSYVLIWVITWLISAIILKKGCLRQDLKEELQPHEKLYFIDFKCVLFLREYDIACILNVKTNLRMGIWGASFLCNYLCVNSDQAYLISIWEGTHLWSWGLLKTWTRMWESVL